MKHRIWRDDSTRISRETKMISVSRAEDLSRQIRLSRIEERIRRTDRWTSKYPLYRKHLKWLTPLPTLSIWQSSDEQFQPIQRNPRMFSLRHFLLKIKRRNKLSVSMSSEVSERDHLSLQRANRRHLKERERERVTWKLSEKSNFRHSQTKRNSSVWCDHWSVTSMWLWRWMKRLRWLIGEWRLPAGLSI